VLTVVLPAYNESSALPSLLAEIDDGLGRAAIGYRVIVVDDGSTDATAAILASAGARYPLATCRHATNRGLGPALATGLRAALADRASDMVVTMDADRTHEVSCIAGMVGAIGAGADVVIASRFQRRAVTSGVPLRRRLLSQAANQLLASAHPAMGVRDFTSGFRAYRASVLERAFVVYGDDLLRDPGFACTPGLLLRVARLGARLAEVPIALRYERKTGPSKLSLLDTARGAWRLVASPSRHGGFPS
jgi:dolichol-phosphate mannosyltransferase